MNEDLWGLGEASLLNALMENVADSIYFKDRRCRLVRVSRKMALDLGVEDAKMLVGKTDVELFGEEFGRQTMIDDMQIMETGEAIIGLVESRMLASGETNWTSTTKTPMRDPNGKVIGLLGITREINELKRTEQNLQYLATHDILTSLPNRYLLYDRLDQTIRRARRNETSFAVLYIDLDDFKSINDRYGHDIGDYALKQIAARLEEAVRDSDTVARMGGDEFVIILEAISLPEKAMRVAQKVRAKIDEELDFFGKQEMVTASVGISLYPKHGAEAAMLLRAADHAMYDAKRQKHACALFEAPENTK